MNSKRGQGLSTNAIILIVLGLIVLAILVLGFTLGWSSLKGFVAPSTNVKNVAQACQTACLTEATYDFCSINRTVKDGVNDDFDATCFQLSNDTAYQERNYGISSCPQITCS